MSELVTTIDGERITRESAEAYRQRYSRECKERIAAARAACGEAKAYGLWRFVDRTGVEPDVVVYCCRQAGEPGWQPSSEAAFPRAATERLGDLPLFDLSVMVRGERRFGFRWETNFASLSDYNPRPSREKQPVKPRRRRKRRAKR